jgi:hypothetical protein
MIILYRLLYVSSFGFRACFRSLASDFVLENRQGEV